MAIDLKKQGRVLKKTHRKAQTTNLYHRLIIKLYKFLARRTDSKVNQQILHRLHASNVNRYPLGLSRIVKNTQGDKANKIVVAPTTITNDVRLLEFPKRTIVALRFTEAARKRIVKAGGECLTFDQLALRDPTGANALLLRGPKVREQFRHFGLAPGVKGSHSAPYVRSNGRKFERARGRK